MTSPAAHQLDVRPSLAQGQDPFALIMQAVDGLQPGQPLVLIAPFRPVPLFNVMANRGFTARDRQLPDGGWQVEFTPVAGEAVEEGLAPGSAPGAALWPDPARTLDLSGLMPPEPMVRILETIDRMAPGEVLFATLDREPMFLFPELAMRHHEWAGNFAADGATYRLLVRRGI